VAHEWLTNAANYGALSVPDGRLNLTLALPAEQLNEPPGVTRARA